MPKDTDEFGVTTQEVTLVSDPASGNGDQEVGPPSAATRLRLRPDLARYDRETIDQILDEALICHLGLIADGRPLVLPTIHARLGDFVYAHGSGGQRLYKLLKSGVDVCLTAMVLDGIVLARSAFFSTMNYRSVVVMGRTQHVTDPEEKQRAFEAIVEHVAPGRWDDCRRPTTKEARATTIVRLPLNEYSAKVRSGPPRDPVKEHDLPHWAGVIPLALRSGMPEGSPDLKPGRREPPPYTLNYTR